MKSVFCIVFIIVFGFCSISGARTFSANVIKINGIAVDGNGQPLENTYPPIVQQHPHFIPKKDILTKLSWQELNNHFLLVCARVDEFDEKKLPTQKATECHDNLRAVSQACMAYYTEGSDVIAGDVGRLIVWKVQLLLLYNTKDGCYPN